MLSGCAVRESLSNKQATNPSISSWEKTTQDGKIGQIKVSISLVLENMGEDLTTSRITAGIGHPRAFESQCLPAAEGANSPKMKFFNAMACLEPGLAEFNNMLD
jgi:hypothetical protein